MQIDLPFHLVQKLKQLLSDLDAAYQEHGTTETNEYSDIYFDDQDSDDSNSDPVRYNSINRETLKSASELKAALRL